MGHRTNASPTRISTAARPDLYRSRHQSRAGEKDHDGDPDQAPPAAASTSASFAEYCDYVFTPEARPGELVHLIDVITTNKTDFFREAAHFDFLVSKALPDLAARKASTGSRWSGARAAPPARSPTPWPWSSASIPRRVPVFGSASWQPISRPPCWTSRAGHLQVRDGKPHSRGICGESTSCAAAIRVGAAARGSGAARPGRVPAAQLHGLRLRPGERPKSSSAATSLSISTARPRCVLSKSSPANSPGRLLFRGPFGIPARHGFAAGARGAIGLPEARMETERHLPDLNLQPGELYLARSPAILRTIWDRAWASLSGARAWAPARCAMASCPGARQAGLRHPTWPRAPLRGLQHSLPGAEV